MPMAHSKLGASPDEAARRSAVRFSWKREAPKRKEKPS